MPILTATNLKHTYAHRTILDGINLTIEPGERIGIVGRNGCGKSTLIKILEGILVPDFGTVALGKGVRSGYMQQDPRFADGETLRSGAETAFAELHQLHHDLNEVFEQMATAEGDQLEKLLKKQERLEQAISAAGGYAVDHKIDTILHGLGFTDAQFALPANKLSGGQRSRLALAIAMLQQPEILLLDEPTNHLDIEGRIWLENFLKNEFQGAVVMISHDRYLLDNVVTRIIEIENGRLIDYPGNYEAFREIRAQRRLTQLRAFENQQNYFNKEQAFIDRYRAGQRARQAQGRISKLGRLKEASTLERPMELDSMRLSLPKAERTGDIVLTAREIAKRFTREDGSVLELFKGLDLVIGRGERWGIIGPNGTGKSTLIRVLMKELEPDEGKVTIGSNVKVGYFRQTHDHLDLSQNVYTYLQNVLLKEIPGLGFSEQQARDLAGAFMFSGTEQDKPLSALSGGERSRAVLAGLIASAKNVLVMDEPTNHLDIPSAERLEQSLLPSDEETKTQGFDGVLLLISHDRALIDATCEHLIVFGADNSVEIFHGNYSEWFEKDQAKKKAAKREADAEKERQQEQEKRRRQQAEARAKQVTHGRSEAERSGGRNSGGGSAGAGGGNGSKPVSNPLSKWSTEKISSRIEQIEKRIKQIDAELMDPAVWKDPAKGERIGSERAKLATELEPLEYEYLSRQG